MKRQNYDSVYFTENRCDKIENMRQLLPRYNEKRKEGLLKLIGR